MSEKKKRHPFRFLFKLVLAGMVISGLARLVAARRNDFYGLTESEARIRLESKLVPRIGAEKAAMVSEKVIPKLKEKGIVKPDPVEQAVEEAKETVGEASESIEEAVENIAEELD